MRDKRLTPLTITLHIEADKEKLESLQPDQVEILLAECVVLVQHQIQTFKPRKPN